MSMIKSYAAKAAGSELELDEYDAGELSRKMLKCRSITAGFAILICR
ncbi:hypothetical protein ACNKHK_27205 [Shigella flexneri]